MPELVSIFRETAEWYRQRGADVCMFLELEADRLCEHIQVLQALSDDKNGGAFVDDDYTSSVTLSNQRYSGSKVKL